jgi:hypothetical protein
LRIPTENLHPDPEAHPSIPIGFIGGLIKFSSLNAAKGERALLGFGSFAQLFSFVTDHNGHCFIGSAVRI